MKNFKSDDDDKGSKVAAIVEQYLIDRLATGKYAIAQSPNALLSGQEEEAYYRNLIERIEDQAESIQRT